jgi:large subunit ribosomal protein L35
MASGGHAWPRIPIPAAWCGLAVREGRRRKVGPADRLEVQMPKMKTKSSVKKRFRLTATGMVKAGAGNKRHMLTAKTNKMKRQNRGAFVLDKQDGDTVKQWMPYGSSR